jgi:hypothetical protein
MHQAGLWAMMTTQSTDFHVSQKLLLHRSIAVQTIATVLPDRAAAAEVVEVVEVGSPCEIPLGSGPCRIDALRGRAELPNHTHNRSSQVSEMLFQPAPGFAYCAILNLPSWDACTSSGPSARRIKRCVARISAKGTSSLTPMPPKI